MPVDRMGTFSPCTPPLSSADCGAVAEISAPSQRNIEAIFHATVVRVSVPLSTISRSSSGLCSGTSLIGSEAFPSAVNAFTSLILLRTSLPRD